MMIQSGNSQGQWRGGTACSVGERLGGPVGSVQTRAGDGTGMPGPAFAVAEPERGKAHRRPEEEEEINRERHCCGNQRGDDP